jgi:hypothetical protein
MTENTNDFIQEVCEHLQQKYKTEMHKVTTCTRGHT